MALKAFQLANTISQQSVTNITLNGQQRTHPTKKYIKQKKRKRKEKKNRKTRRKITEKKNTTRPGN